MWLLLSQWLSFSSFCKTSRRQHHWNAWRVISSVVLPLIVNAYAKIVLFYCRLQEHRGIHAPEDCRKPWRSICPRTVQSAVPQHCPDGPLLLAAQVASQRRRPHFPVKSRASRAALRWQTVERICKLPLCLLMLRSHRKVHELFVLFVCFVRGILECSIFF